jgi:SAM-dependent methyltransferase
VAPDRYNFSKNDVFLAAQAVDRATMKALQKAEFTDLRRVRLLEIGCGGGGNLLRFLRWGFAPQNLVGNELLEERAQAAERILPRQTRILLGDARSLPDDEFDVVYQSTVLSSI